MNKLTPEIKLNIQLGIAIVLVAAGLILLFCGFFIDPQGEIHNSVLVAFGECCTFAGSLVGVDYHYRFKTYEDRRHHHQPPYNPDNDETFHDPRTD